MNIKFHTSPDGARISYCSVISDEPRALVVLVLPFGLQIKAATHLISKFAEKYNVVTWESRYILSPKEQAVPEGGLTVEKHVDDLFSLLNFLGVNKDAILLGYCSGAGIALAAADREPQRIAKVVLANGEFLLFDQPDSVSTHTKDIDNLLPLAAQSIKNADMVVRLLADSQGAGDRENVPAEMMVPYGDADYFHRFAINYQSYKATDYQALAKRLQKETLVMGGRCDMQTNADSARVMHQILPKSSLYISDDGDHYHFYRCNDRYMDEIDNFISQGVSNA